MSDFTISYKIPDDIPVGATATIQGTITNVSGSVIKDMVVSVDIDEIKVKGTIPDKLNHNTSFTLDFIASPTFWNLMGLDANVTIEGKKVSK